MTLGFYDTEICVMLTYVDQTDVLYNYTYFRFNLLWQRGVSHLSDDLNLILQLSMGDYEKNMSKLKNLLSFYRWHSLLIYFLD